MRCVLLMYLRSKDDQLATIAEIAKSFAISRNHLMKVAYQLGVAGYVETVRGRGGGLRLAKPAATIGLGDVVRCTEPDMAIASCFKPLEAPCAIRPCCVLKRALEKAHHAFVDVLDGYTLGDLVQPRGRLVGLLGHFARRKQGSDVAGGSGLVRLDGAIGSGPMPLSA